ncbi:MAG: hypothetical protein AB1894_29820 [Chloroflexota bacterium]
MSINPQTPWHKASYDRFLYDTLPQLLAERLPLVDYQVSADDASAHTCTLAIELSGGVQARYPGIPRPDEAGLFYFAGEPYVVIPLADREELGSAEIDCVGEQLYAYIQACLGQASNGLHWDAEILRAWLPLERWVSEFMQNKAQPLDAMEWFMRVQRLDTTNWLSRHTHLRRLLIPRREKVIAPGQMGRVCPFETPEGPNIGRAFTIAVGAEIRERRLVVVDERPEASLGLSASMLPFLENNDPNRLLMAANMLRQGLPHNQPEPAWVQTGLEPDAPDFWCGHNLLTAFVSWGPGTSEDGILLSESAARRLHDPFPVQVGDKLSNRHGSKGVVSFILPDEHMPHLPDGTPVELVYNFPGLRTRMHLGQVREAVMGHLARQEGAPVIVPPFHAPSPEELRQRLAAAGLPENGMETLTQGKDGPPLERPSAAGWVYWTRLAHLSSDKLRLTLDDARGGAQGSAHAGQMLGEMEFNVLKEMGAVASLHEALNARTTRSTWEAASSFNTPPIFNDLARRLQVAGIRAELEDGRLAFRFAPPDGETLELARPQPHPWLSERPLEAIGVVPEADTTLPGAEFARLAEANQQLARLLSSRAPERLARQAEARLQAALNALFDVLLPPETLAFRERQLFSGRAVIAPSLDLRFDQVGFPESLCWQLFGPQVAGELQDGSSPGPENPRAVQALDALLARSWVLVNRAPTFSSTALLAFHPVRDPGNVIRLNPILCRWMNADFDGDQSAFYLPLSAAAQQEAGELISVAGQLSHNPALVKTLLPPPEVIWGLAWRSLTPAGRSQIAQITGVPEQAFEPLLTQAGLSDLLATLLERHGVDRMLATLQSLTQLGYEAARASGASMSPFIQMDAHMPPAPEGDDPERWEIYAEELAEKVLSSTNYQDVHIGPQLLEARARPWNRHSLPMVVGVRGVVAGVDGEAFIVRHNYAQGFTPEEMFACVAGARQGFAQIHLQSEQMVLESKKRGQPAGLNVLGRARRARRPGIVFARAAASGEVDPLQDLDSRLLAGLA